VTSPLKIVFVVPGLGPGGAERSTGNLARGLSDQGQYVTVIALDHESEPCYVELGPAVRLIRLGLWAPSRNCVEAVRANTRRILILRAHIRALNPDCVISAVTETNVVALLATGKQAPVIVWEHTDPYRWHLKRYWRWARWMMYRRAASLVVLSEYHASYFKKRFFDIRLVTIPNSILLKNETSEIPNELTRHEPFILAVGRLDRFKGVHLLLTLFAKLNAHQRGWSLVIVGDGDQRSVLEQLAEELEIVEAVCFAGAVTDPHSYYRACDIFVSLSEIEGFPMALLEAMSYGCPVVINEYSPAVYDIVKNGKNGFVVNRNDLAGTCDVINRLMNDEELKRNIGEEAKSIQEQLSLPNVLKYWQVLIATLVWS